MGEHHGSHHACSKQFASFFCSCESFIFRHEQTCWGIFRCIGKRETKPSSLRTNDCGEHSATRMPTWTITQHVRQNIKLEATPSAKTGVSKDSERVNTTTPGASSSGQLETRGASSSRRPVATEDLSSGKKVHLRPNIDGQQYIKKFDDPAENLKRQSEEEHEFYNQVLNIICARFFWYPDNLQDFPLNDAILSQFTSDCCIRMAMNQSFPRTQDLIQSVQRQVKILIISYASLARLEHISRSRIRLLVDPAAKLIRMSQIHPTTGKQNWRMYETNTDLTKN